jgi:hypothetical protein
VTSTSSDHTRPAEAVAGLLAAGALFLGGFELLYRPFRLAPAALIMLVAATIMSREQQGLIKVAYAAVGIGFVVGAAIQVLTHHPLY